MLRQIELFDFQKIIIKCWCEGLEVRTARCAGRSFLANAFGKYVAHLYSENDYNVKPYVIIPYYNALDCGLIDEGFISEMRNSSSEKSFNRDFLGIDTIKE
mgnify:CR=1 FL=1